MPRFPSPGQHPLGHSRHGTSRFQDEARIGQKDKITRRWARRGSSPAAPHDQRIRSAHIFGAICPKEGKGAGLVLPRRIAGAMRLRLAEIAQAVAPGAHAVVLLDQAGWHMTDKLAVPANIILLPILARSPGLNAAENVWQFLRDNWLSNRVFKSYAGYPRSQLLRLELPHGPALEDHVHRPPRLGSSVMNSAGWYYSRFSERQATGSGGSVQPASGGATWMFSRCGSSCRRRKSADLKPRNGSTAADGGP